MNDMNLKLKNIYDMVSRLKVESTPHNVELLYSTFYTIKTLMEDIESLQQKEGE